VNFVPYLYHMKCTFIYSILFGFISFAMTAQSLNVDLMQGLQNKLVRWQAIDLNQPLTYSYSKLTTSHETIALFAAYHGIKGLMYQTCNGLACTSWQAIAPDEHVAEGGEANNEAKSLLFLDPNHDQIIFAFDKKNDNASLKLALRYYLNENENHEITTFSDRKCTCSPLSFINRTQWNCPDTEETSLYTPDYTQHTHIVIHHQAGSANPPYANTVKAIWDFHVNGNGWSDIGYNWLIAPDGTIYKGRSWLNGDQNVRGAHTCACNSNKLGICLLGDLTTKLPTAAQYESLKNFIVWKACELDILPDTSSTIVSSRSGTCIDEYVHHITGHRDNCGSGYTACPGDKFYPSLQTLISEVIQQYKACSDTLNTGVTEQLPMNASIYPMPNDANFYIENNDSATLTIYNSFGQAVRHYSLAKGKQYVSTKLQQGLYRALLTNGTAMQSFPIVIQH
jgi:N-acetylmuramoyl-L-alanine amidase